MASTEEINYSVFEAQDVRLVLKNRSQCLRAGFPISHPIIVTFNEIRDEYIKRVGLATYLSQMLGPLAVVPISRCTLYQTDSREIVVHLNGHGQQPVQRFIRNHFNLRNLPFKIAVAQGDSGESVEIRYL
jgi:hypothetical protein